MRVCDFARLVAVLVFFFEKSGFHSFIIFGDYSPNYKDTLK